MCEDYTHFYKTHFLPYSNSKISGEGGGWMELKLEGKRGNPRKDTYW